MSMYVCIYVCMYVSVCVCVCVIWCMCVPGCICACVCTLNPQWLTCSDQSRSPESPQITPAFVHRSRSGT